MATANPLTDLATVLQTMFLGSSKSGGESTTTSSSADKDVISKLQTVMDEALANAANPDAVKPVVDKIIKDATIAFAPNLAREAAGGMYNSTVKQMLSGQAAGDAASAVSTAVLNYKTGQQQIATQAGKTLVDATRTTASNSGSKANANPALPGGISQALLGGLGLYSAYRNKDKLVNFLTGGSENAAGAADLISNPDVLSTVMGADFQAGQAALELPAWADITQSPDLYNTVMGGAPTETVTHIFDNIGEYIPLDFGDAGIKLAGDAADVTKDVVDWAGDAIDITEFFGDIGDFAGNIFDEFLSFF